MTSTERIASGDAHRLTAAGFRYYSFISYPGTDDSMRRFAKQFHSELEALLSRNLPSCQTGNGCKYAFLDKICLAEGPQWERDLGVALCQSITMVALCVPMYSHPEHAWCGREWAGMEELGQRRLPNGPDSIFVVKLGELPPLDDRIACVRPCNLSEHRLQRLEGTAAFYRCLKAALHHVVAVSRAWLDSHPDPAPGASGSGASGSGASGSGASGSGSDCREYRLPEFSAFGPASTPLIASRQTDGVPASPEASA